jgi:crossover junction endodeoxyribonuclease RuvC
MGISPEAFRKLQARVQSPKRRPEPLSGSPSSLAPSRHQVILGIDPSLRGTGWGVIRHQRGDWAALGFGTIHCAASMLRSRCLVRIADELRAAIRQHQPTACAIEGLFFAQNLQTALLMGEARGVCLLAAAEAGLEIIEMAPRKVKQAIVGFGGRPEGGGRPDGATAPGIGGTAGRRCRRCPGAGAGPCTRTFAPPASNLVVPSNPQPPMQERAILAWIILLVLGLLLGLVILVTALGVARHLRKHRNKGPEAHPKHQRPSDDEADVDSPEGWRKHARPEDNEPE